MLSIVMSIAVTVMWHDTRVVRAVFRQADIAYAVRFLVTDEAAFVHGSILDVDGGIDSTRLNF